MPCLPLPRKIRAPGQQDAESELSPAAKTRDNRPDSPAPEQSKPSGMTTKKGGIQRLRKELALFLKEPAPYIQVCMVADS
jgi:hypothetical protein